eukprot:2095795-Pyramimonas_sp.AAC.1
MLSARVADICPQCVGLQLRDVLDHEGHQKHRSGVICATHPSWGLRAHANLCGPDRGTPGEDADKLARAVAAVCTPTS